MSQIRLVAMKDGTVMVETPYSPQFVADIKSKIPWQARRWDGDQKAWFVTPGYIDTIVAICENVFGVSPPSPNIAQSDPVTKIIQLDYIGNCKTRGDREPSAYGWLDDGWNIVFPERVLLDWFLRDPDPTGATTWYAALGVPRTATGEEIKRAYRRAVRTHHPDKGGDPDHFRAIQTAYEVLKDPKKRALYDSGLAMAAAVPKDLKPGPIVTWRPPIRCGFLMVTARELMGGKLEVIRIEQWQDVVKDGKTMYTYWPPGADIFVKTWR